MYDTRVIFNNKDVRRIDEKEEETTEEEGAIIEEAFNKTEESGDDSPAVAELLPLNDDELLDTIMAKEIIMSPDTLDDGPLMLFRVRAD